MLRIAEALVAQGADVNDPLTVGAARLSPLFGAIGHAGNMPLARWLLEQGANPNDGESLYHATELGHAEGVRLLLAHGARPEGTNALLRALDIGHAETVAALLEGGADPNGERRADAVPPLHHAARRMCPEAICDLLLNAGADPGRSWHGLTAYALARVHGHAALARRLADAGAETALSPVEGLLASAAEGAVPEGAFVDPAKLPPLCRDLIGELAQRPGAGGHIRALAGLGLEYDRPGPDGVTPVQSAGWSGLADNLRVLLALRPDLGHVNGHGGTLLTTIIHGSENAPRGADVDHVACARIALEEGVALSRAALRFAGDREMADFLAGWASEHPGALVA